MRQAGSASHREHPDQREQHDGYDHEDFEDERGLRRSFEGHAAPYIQYAHARASRILEHAGETESSLLQRLEGLDFGTLQAEELSLLQTIASLPEEIQRAAE